MKRITQKLKESAKKTISVVLAFLLIAAALPFMPVKAASGDVTGNAAFRVIAYNTSARIEMPYISGTTTYKVYFSTNQDVDLTTLNSDASKVSVLSSSYTPTTYTTGISPNTTYYFYFVTNNGSDTLQSTFEAKTWAAAKYWTDSGNYDTSWYTGGPGPFNISTSQQLAGLAVLVNAGNSFSGKTINLTASLDMSAYLWTPIGTATSDWRPTNPFQGTFDGGNYVGGTYTDANVIKGLHTNNGAESFQGLFGFNDNGTIKNVGVVDGYIKGQAYTAGIVGENFAGTVSNCFNTSSVNGTISTAGVVGNNEYNNAVADAVIINCYNTGSITGTSSVGGVAGSNVENGSGQSSSIINCFNTGSVTGSDAEVGGIVGYSRQDGKISNCYNSGAVNNSSTQTGGIAGLNWGAITNCYNIGSVSGTSDVGGIAGQSQTNPITNSYNTGTVNGTSNLGGVVGLATSGILSNSYNTGTVSAGTNVGGVVGSRTGTTITNTYYLSTTAATGIGSGSGTATAESSANLQTLAGTLGAAAWITAPTTYATGGVFSGGNLVNQGYPVLCSFGYTAGTTGAGFSPDVTINTSTGVITVGTTYGDGTSGNPYIIRNIYQLDLARNDSSSAFRLANNIDISPAQYNAQQNQSGSWKPYSTTSAYPFNGTFDGNGFSVSGIYINNNYQNQSLIGCSSGTVENVGVSGGFVSEGEYTAGVVAFNYGGGNVTNCYNLATVFSSDLYTGGVVGSGTATNCYNAGSVASTSAYVGGVVGYGTPSNCYNLGTVTSTYLDLGGVVGQGNATNCYNTGLISGAGNYTGGVIGGGNATNSNNTGSVNGAGNYTGGVVGMGNATNSNNTGSVNGAGNYTGGVTGSGNVTLSYNTGTVKGNTDTGGVSGNLIFAGSASNSYNTGTVTGTGNSVGGVVGYNNSSATINYSYNTGNVTATGASSGYIGGVAGTNYGTVSSSYNTGNVAAPGAGSLEIGGIAGINNSSASVSSSYSTGTVSGATDAGGVVGYNSSGTINNTYYSGSSTGIGGLSDVGGKTTPFIKLNANSINIGAATTLTLQTGLNTNSTWETDLGANFNIAYSYAASPAGYINIAGTNIQGTNIGSPNITGTITITQNSLTTSGFTGPTVQIVVPINLGLLTVTQATPTIAVSSIAATSVGAPITLTATLAGGYNPTGTVTFYNYGSSIGSTGTITAGIATFTYTPTITGSLSITAAYSGDGNNTAVSTSGAQTATVSKNTPSLSIPTATPTSPQTYPVSSVTLSATLSSYYETVLGQTVSFYNGATQIGSGTADSSGKASFIWTNPGANTYTITAKFAGDANNNSVISSGLSYNVNLGTQSALTIGGVPSTVTYGDSSFALTNTGGSGTGSTYTYSSSDQNILTVDASGNVTVKGAGTATITVIKAGDANYNSISAPVTITVAPKILNVTITPHNKTYDGLPDTTAGTIFYDSRVNSDTSSDIYATGGTLAFADPKAGNNKTVTASSYMLAGDKTADYTLGTVTVNPTDITKTPLTVTNTGVNDKAYDGTTTAAFSGTPALSGKVSGDDVTLTNGMPTFASKDYSVSAIPVNFTSFSITGADEANYILTQPSPVTASILQKTLTVTNTGINNKVYDGTTAAAFSGTPALSGKVSGDDVTLTNGMPTFASKDYSVSAIPVNFSNFGITGTDAANYSLTQPSPVLAFISKKTLDVSVNPVTIPCGEAIPALAVTVSGFVPGENESSLAGFAPPTASQSYGSTTTPVTNASMAVTYTGGNATDNYQFPSAGTAQLTIQAIGINNGDYQVAGNYSTSANPTGWNSGDLTITPINGYDEISVDGSNWLPGLSVSTEAVNGSVTFELKDSSDGLQSEYTTIYYNLDKTAPIAPSITINGGAPEGASEWYGGTTYPAITITPQTSVNGSAPETTYYKLWKNGDTEPGSGTVFTGAQPTISSDGVWHLVVWTADAAGNRNADVTTTINVDTAAPTGTVTIHGNTFSSFLNTITFGLFFKQTVDVTIAGSDTLSGIKTIAYQKVADGSAYHPDGPWASYSNPFSVSPNEKFIVYAKIADNAGNVTIINSNGVVVYTDSALASTTASFNKDTSAPGYKDISITMNLNNNTLKDIENGQNTLAGGTDYTISGDIVTLKKEYLETAVNGSLTLTFRFNPMGEVLGSGDAPETAQLTINESVDAAATTFTANLSGEKTYSEGDAATPLIVNASAADGGTITYQWYENSDYTTNGTAISGATTAAFTPKTDKTGIFYYYVTATNTNNAVNGNQTSVATSGIYKVTVNNLEVLAPEASNDTPATTLQEPSGTVEQAVITDADKDKLADGSDISIYLRVEKTDAPQADQNAVSTALDGKTMGQYLDISLIKNIDGSETKVSQTNSPLRITIAIPENLRGSGRVFEIVRVHDGVAVTLPDLDTDPNTITIETDRFSTYAIVYSNAASKPVENPKTGDRSPIIPLALLGFGSLTTALAMSKKRRYKVIGKR